MRFTAFSIVVLVSTLSGQGTILSTWKGVWTAYQTVDDGGEKRTLLKATVTMPTPAQVGWSMVLRDPAGQEIGTTEIPPGSEGQWAHGFWVLSERTDIRRIFVELRKSGKIAETTVVTLDSAPPPIETPLRLDRLNRALLHRLETRESGAVSSVRADVAAYLSRHDVVYREPSRLWDEGLPAGNGDLGALVTGEAGKRQSVLLDKTDIWLATAEQKPLGRSYVGELHVRFAGNKSDSFVQRLSLGTAEVRTRDGDFRSSIRVDALRNRLEMEIVAGRFEIELERPPVPLWDNRAARLWGSWNAVSAPASIETIRRLAESAPKTVVDWGSQDRECWFVHRAPSLSYATTLRVENGEVNWACSGDRCTGAVRSTPGRAVRITAAVVTSREQANPLAEAHRIAGEPANAAGHQRWWRDFWSRSWIDIPDKVEENLWYIGLYQQAACSRSDQAVSFFGLWHPLNLKTWYDGYVSDAQVEMMWWETFATNHLELLYPSHRTFGRSAAGFAQYTPGQGMVPAHLFVPEWAGGRSFFTGSNPYKGSIAWYGLNFWWDYLYSGDEQFLREVTYPILRMAADYFTSDLVKESDGYYHSLNSSSPEQSNSSRDNIYDWSMITALYRAILRASGVLKVDDTLRPQWRDRLDHLFPAPGDGQTLWETPTNHYPYRCHPVVLFSLYPTNAISRKSPLFESARRTIPVVTRLVGFQYEDRHEPIPGFDCGVEPNGFSSGILAIAAARLNDRDLYHRILYGLIVRFHLKQNGLRALLDTRQSSEIGRASLVEAANAATVASTETLLQSWDDEIRLFGCIGSTGRYRFAGLRAFGGFVVSAGARDGETEWVQVKSLLGGPLRLVLPARQPLRSPAGASWRNAGDGIQEVFIETKPEAVYEFTRRPVDFKMAAAGPRDDPRRIPLMKVENVGFNFYPQYLPFGQVIRDEFIYLGRPAAYGSPRSVPRAGDLLTRVTSPRWEDRQDAALQLGRVKPDQEVLSALESLCSDPVNVVANTAAVTLVKLGTAESVAIAKREAAKDRVAGLKREVEKAIGRVSNPAAATWNQ